MCYHNRLAIILLAWTCVAASDLTHLRCTPSPNNCTIARQAEWTETKAIFDLGGPLSLTVEVKVPQEVSYTCIKPWEYSSASHFKSFPKFDRDYHFEKVVMANCDLPQEPYRSILDDLNITGFHYFTLELDTCNQNTLLRPNLFAGLRDLLTLDIFSFLQCKEASSFDFLNRLENLKSLILRTVKFYPFPSWNLLQSISLYHCAPAKQLQHWGGCKALEELKIEGWYKTELPDSWLANCSGLTSVHLQYFADLETLPRRMFNSTSLHTMKLIDCNIRDLPIDFFDHIINLRVLDLSKNKLQDIKRDTFSPLTSLEKLVVLDNCLYEIESMINFAPLSSLKVLILGSSFRSNGCKMSELDVKSAFKCQSPLFPSLERLSLDGFYVTKICSQWNQSMPKLKYLNLTKTKISELKYEDIELIQFNGWDVDLRHSKLEAIEFNESDYEAVLNLAPVSSNATIRIGRNITGCDHRWYWFARTVIEYPGYLYLPDLLCNQHMGKPIDPVLLKTMTLESFVCEEHNCWPECHCLKSVSDNNTVHINCTGAGLDYIPRYPFMRTLHMAFNNVKTIHAYDLPETLKYMDLQNNQLSTLDMEIASMMFNRSTTIYNLENNHIICECNTSALINLLQSHKNQICTCFHLLLELLHPRSNYETIVRFLPQLENYENVACADGSQLHQANTFVLCLRSYTPVIGGFLSAIAIICLIVIVLYYRYRSQIYIILYAWGWCTCCVNEEELDKDKRYDVFISFAHEDTSLVMDQLVPELEKEPHAFSVCVHYRDWMPGEWIPTQIAHSVLQSRRTIIVLSENFLSSIWALLEFRTAHTQAMKDGRVRLIIVLLGDVINNEGMDDELRAYLTTNTYIKWGDPMFWDKLRYALPHRTRDELRSRAAGEEVLKLARPTDPPNVLRNMLPPNNNILSIEPAQIEEAESRL